MASYKRYARNFGYFGREMLLCIVSKVNISLDFDLELDFPIVKNIFRPNMQISSREMKETGCHRDDYGKLRFVLIPCGNNSHLFLLFFSTSFIWEQCLAIISSSYFFFWFHHQVGMCLYTHQIPPLSPYHLLLSRHLVPLPGLQSHPCCK